MKEKASSEVKKKKKLPNSSTVNTLIYFNLIVLRQLFPLLTSGLGVLKEI